MPSKIINNYPTDFLIKQYENDRFTHVTKSKALEYIKDFGKNEKELLSIIYSLSRGGLENVFASNKYLSDCLGVKNDRVSKLIAKLKEFKLIYTIEQKEKTHNDKFITNRLLCITGLGDAICTNKIFLISTLKDFIAFGLDNDLFLNINSSFDLNTEEIKKRIESTRVYFKRITPPNSKELHPLIQKYLYISINNINIRNNTVSNETDNSPILENNQPNRKVKNIESSIPKKRVNHNVIIADKYWDLLENIINRYPKKHIIKKDKPSKIIIRVYKFLKELESNKFKNKKFNEKLLKNIDLSILDNITDFNSVKSALIKAVNRFAKVQDNTYTYDPSSYAIPDIDSFIFNPRTMNSLFLSFLANKPKKKESFAIDSIKNTIPEKARSTAERLFYKNQYNELSFWSRIQELYKWYTANYEGICLVHPEWKGYAGSFRSFLELYKEGFLTWQSFGIGNIGVKNKTWNYFVEWCKAERAIDIKPSKTRIKLANREKERFNRNSA
jgi:hypothetical protein